MLLKHKVVSSRIIPTLLAISLSFGLLGCEDARLPQLIKDFSVSGISKVGFDSHSANLAEVAPPQALAKLDQFWESSRPQVSIINPRPQTTLQNVNVVVDLDLKGYQLFKDQDLKLGPHLSLILDDEPYQDIYDLAKPVVLKNLKPGTHQLRVLVEKPWFESFKNPEAFAQTTFNVLAETEDDLEPPALIYNQPNGRFQAEPILLDFYVAGMEPNTWQVRATVNDEQFLLEQMQPIYLKGFQTGNNLVQLELLDQQGNVLDSKSDQSIHLITYEPGQPDPDFLAKLVSGEISFEESVFIVDQNYFDSISENDFDQKRSPENANEGTDSEDFEQGLLIEEEESQLVSPTEEYSLEEEQVIANPEVEPENDSVRSQKSEIAPDSNLDSSPQAEDERQEQNLSSSPEAASVNSFGVNNFDKLVEADEQEVTEAEEPKEIENNESLRSKLNNSVVEAEPELSLENDSKQVALSLDSVPTNSVSEKVRTLTEAHPDPLAKMSPLPIEVQVTSKAESLELKPASENSFPSADVSREKPDLNQPEESAIANEIINRVEEQVDFSSIEQKTKTESADLPLEILDNQVFDNYDRSDDSDLSDLIDDNSLSSNQFDFKEFQSQINSTLAVWLTRASGVWRQVRQQAISLVNKAVTTWQANVSAS